MQSQSLTAVPMRQTIQTRVARGIFDETMWIWKPAFEQTVVL
jgi:hypothetical protein